MSMDMVAFFAAISHNSVCLTPARGSLLKAFCPHTMAITSAEDDELVPPGH